jgi:hypothetical protein
LVIETLGIFHSVSIPSRRVGDQKEGCRMAEQQQVSIPSRRVGDLKPHDSGVGWVKFPSPQGGSETKFWRGWRRSWVLFPSPQGGSETERARD